MANWSNPTTASTYTNFVTEVKDRDVDLAMMLDPAVTTPTLTPSTGMVRFDSANGFFQRYVTSAWTNIANFAFNTTGAAGRWLTARTITLAGDLAGSTSIDGSANVTLTATIGTISATKGGTGQTSYAVGDLLYASTTTTVAKLADVVTGNVLLSGGVGVPPNYGPVGLTTHVTGVLPLANGGTGATTAANARIALGALATGEQLFIAGSAAAARTVLGAGVIGDAVFVAASAAAARTTLGSTATGDAVFVAASAAAARATLGALGSGDTILNATNAVSSSTAAVKDSTTAIATTAFVDRLRSLMPSTTTGTLVLTDRGALVPITAAITVPSGVFSANDVVTIFNNTSGPLTVTQGAGLTLRTTGTSYVGSTPVGPWGLATVLFVSPTVALISGNI
jgi:hypothetical protein